MTKTVALRLYRGASWAAGPLAPAILRRRVARGKEDPARLHERLGRPSVPRPAGPLIWVHGASVGEAVSMLPLIARLVASGRTVLVTTGTVASAQHLEGSLPAGAIHQYVPVDTLAAVRGFLDHWRPDLAIWVESELWPALLSETAARSVAMAWINARLSSQSARRWSLVPRTARALLGSFVRIWTQDQQTVTALSALGLAAHPAGNFKALVGPPPVDVAILEKARRAVGERPVWLAASTHAPEEALAIAAHRSIVKLLGSADPPLMILAPRHPHRAGEAAETVRGARYVRWSEGAYPAADTDVWLADTIGDMGLWYRLAPVTFVGGSLSGRGGHTPFEPHACGSAVVHGPDVWNFAPSYDALEHAGGSMRVTDATSLADAVAQLLGDAAVRRDRLDRAEAARRAVAPDLDAIAAELDAMIGCGP